MIDHYEPKRLRHERGEDVEPAAERLVNSVVAVSSAVAERWLNGCNTHNRKLSNAVVDRYKADMQAGRWQYAGDPIRFDANGVLLDGQHRLFALALCEPSIVLPFLVIRGLPPEAQLVMDQGYRRTPGQQLALVGTKNAVLVASCVRQLLVWEDGLLFRPQIARKTITTPRVQEWAAQNPERVGALQEHAEIVKRNEVTTSVAGGFFLRAHQAAPEHATEFFRKLSSGAGMYDGHPILALARRIRVTTSTRAKAGDRDTLALLITAWNRWVTGQSVARLQAPQGGWTPESFPELRTPPTRTEGRRDDRR